MLWNGVLTFSINSPPDRSESGHIINFDKQLGLIIAKMRELTGDETIYFSSHDFRRTASSICKVTPIAANLRDWLIGWSTGDGKKTVADLHYTSIEIKDLRKAAQALADEIYRLGRRPRFEEVSELPGPIPKKSARGKMKLVK